MRYDLYVYIFTGLNWKNIFVLDDIYRWRSENFLNPIFKHDYFWLLNVKLSQEIIPNLINFFEYCKITNDNKVSEDNQTFAVSYYIFSVAVSSLPKLILLLMKNQFNIVT